MRYRFEAGSTKMASGRMRRTVYGMVFLSCLMLNCVVSQAAATTDAGTSPATTGPASTGLPALPLKREDADGIGGAAAMATLACLLLVCGWAFIQLKARGGSGAPARLPRQLQWLQRAMPPPRDQLLRVLESAPLSPHVRLHVVCWRNTEYLVSSTAQEVTVLDKVELLAESPAVAAPHSKPRKRA